MDAPPATTTDAPRKRRESLLVAKAVRGLAPEMFWGADALPALEDLVRRLLARAAYRAACNGRQTVHAWDL